MAFVTYIVALYQVVYFKFFAKKYSRHLGAGIFILFDMFFILFFAEFVFVRL